jgi:hypothetical protein
MAPMVWASIGALVVACNPQMPPSGAPSSGETVVLGVTIAQWREVGLPYPERCEDERSLVRIMRAPQAEIGPWCAPAGLETCKCWACTRRWQVGTWPFRLFGPWSVHFLLSTDSPAGQNGVTSGVIHEGLHWLEMCSRVARAGNRKHDGVVWEEVRPAVHEAVGLDP